MSKRTSTVLSYGAVHEWLRKDRGKASTHVCAVCGKQADEWAYLHEVATEELVDTRGMPYSTNQEDYAPMCRSCHVVYDNGNRTCAWPEGCDRRVVRTDLCHMHRKRQQRRARGMREKKLSRDDVIEILNSPDARAKDLGERFGVSPQYIGDVRKGRVSKAIFEEFKNNRIRD